MFFRGYDVYDQSRAGFVADVGGEGGALSTSSTSTCVATATAATTGAFDMPAADKDALVEYMNTL